MVGLSKLASESRTEVSDASRSAQSSDSKQISGAQQEVQDTRSNGNTGAGIRDVAVLKAADLSADQKSAVGKNFEMSDSDAKPGDYVTALGHPGGDTRASKMCYVSNQISGIVTGEKRGGDLITGNVQDAKMFTLEGMSGGPVVDPDHGNKVVGINHASVNKNTHSEMVPASAVKEQLEKARSGKR